MHRQTKNLIIRDLNLDDVEACFAFRSHPDVTMWMPFDDQTTHDTEAWLQAEIQVNNATPRQVHSSAIVYKDNHHVIGWVVVDLPAEEKQKYGDYILGFCLHPDYWGQGLTTEALIIAIDFCFTETNADSLFAECHSFNAVGSRVCENAGMKKYRYFREGEHTLITFRLEKDQWDAKRIRKYRA